MNVSPATGQLLPVRKPRRFEKEVWFPRLRNVAIAAAVGFLLGSQIHHTQPRIVKAVVGAAVLYAGWKFPIPVSLSAFLILFPFPFAIAYGSSNTIFIFLITAMWLAQIVLKTSRPVGRTILDLPILILVGAYLISFSSVTNSVALTNGLVNVSTILAGIFVYYLIVHTVRDEKTLHRITGIVIITAILSFVIAIYELIFPGRAFIQGWILHSYYTTGVQSGVRVGGPFGDFELYAEYCAMMFPLFLFYLLRAKGKPARILWFGLTLLDFGVLMATVTRGGTISLIVGMTYILIRIRKSVRPRQMFFGVGLGILFLFLFDFLLSTYTVSGSIIERLMNTRLVGGLPDSRTFWPQIVARILEKPWFGHGPYYEFGEYGREKLTKYFWPHNGYLYYLHTIGILGTAAFLWILARLWFGTARYGLKSFWDDDYPRSLALAWHATLTVFMIDQFKIEYLRNQEYQFFPWIVFGMTAATLNVVRAQHPDLHWLRSGRFRRFPERAGGEPAQGPAINDPSPG